MFTTDSFYHWQLNTLYYYDSYCIIFIAEFNDYSNQNLLPEANFRGI